LHNPRTCTGSDLAGSSTGHNRIGVPSRAPLVTLKPRPKIRFDGVRRHGIFWKCSIPIPLASIGCFLAKRPPVVFIAQTPSGLAFTLIPISVVLVYLQNEYLLDVIVYFQIHQILQSFAITTLDRLLRWMLWFQRRTPHVGEPHGLQATNDQKKDVIGKQSMY